MRTLDDAKKLEEARKRKADKDAEVKNSLNNLKNLLICSTDKNLACSCSRNQEEKTNGRSGTKRSRSSRRETFLRG